MNGQLDCGTLIKINNPRSKAELLTSRPLFDNKTKNPYSLITFLSVSLMEALLRIKGETPRATTSLMIQKLVTSVDHKLSLRQAIATKIHKF